MSYEDPFAGRQRLNQLTPEEVLFRNDRMSHQPAMGFEPTMTQEEREEASRQYYVSLTTARAEQLAREMIHPFQSSNENLQDGSTAANLSTSSPTATNTASYQLPYGWNERLNVAPPVSDLSTHQGSRAMSTSAPAVAKTQEAVMHELSIVTEGISCLRNEVEGLVKNLTTEKDIEKKKAFMEELKRQRTLLDKAQQLESDLMLQL